MENKYYTPDIEDIRVGYECERMKKWSQNEKGKYEEWEVFKFPVDTMVIILKDSLKQFRTPYLTKEQIEAEGWKFNTNLLEFKQFEEYTKDNFCMIKMGNKISIIKEDFDAEDWDSVYKGNCPSINEFRIICKLLKIK